MAQTHPNLQLGTTTRDIELERVVQEESQSRRESLETENETSTNGEKLLPLNDASLPPYIKRSATRFWLPEIGAVFLSISAFIAALAVLTAYNHRPLNNWDFPASLNTVIAVLGTISRASIAYSVSACIGQQKWNWHQRERDVLKAFERFDEASRGPYGSAKLLWWLRFRHWAVLGAMVIILSLAFDPFLQATINYTSSLDIDHTITSAITSRLIRLDIGMRMPFYNPSSYSSNTTASVGNGSEQIEIWVEHPRTVADYGWIAAIFNGFNIYSSTKSVSPFSCETGNCTWPVFKSVAVCSSCNDISQHIETFKGQKSQDGKSNFYTDYVLPYVYLTGMDGNYLRQRYYNVMAINATAYPWETISFQNHTTLITSFTLLKAGESFLQNKTAWDESFPIATECAFYYCVNEYELHVSGGESQERVLRSVVDRKADSYQLSSNLNTEYISAVKEYIRASKPALWRREGGFEQTDLQLTFTNSTELFSVSWISIISMIQHLLERSVDLKPYEGGKPFLESVNNFQLITLTPRGEVDSDAETRPLVRILWDNGDYNALFENAARTMTNYLRENGGDTKPVQGETQRWVIHLKTRWPFVVLPTISLLTGCIYVALTIWETRTLGLPVWKESALPSLAYGLNEESKSLLVAADRAGKMEDFARTTVVQFDERDGGIYTLHTA